MTGPERPPAGQDTRRVARAGLRALRRVTGEIGFALYWLARRRRRYERVGSVLQLSIASSKPFMLSRMLRSRGLKSDYFARNADIAGGTLHMGHDYALPASTSRIWRVLLEIFYLWTVLARYDVIHSHFKTLLSHEGWELEYLKRLGTVVIFTFRGCDLRSRTLNMQLHPELNCCQECDYPIGSCDTPYQRGQLALTAKYGDRFFVTTPDLVDFFPGSTHMPFIEPVLLDIDRIPPARKAAGVFRVVTSSNHHGIDGTRFIADAVERLKGEGHPIELVVVSNLPMRDALAIYKSADVYAGKLRLGYYNNANIETMLMGVPNMSFIRDEYHHLAPDCPIINTTPDTVYAQLRHYLAHREELREIGARGPAFVRQYHDAERLTTRLIEEYEAAFRDRGRPRPTPPLPAAIAHAGERQA
jgi:hypothetical protein